MGAPSTGCSGRFWTSPPCFSCPWGARGLFPMAFKPAFLQLPPRCRKSEVSCGKTSGELTIRGQREGKESTLLCLCNPHPLSKWKKKKGMRRWRGRPEGKTFPCHLITLLAVNSQLRPVWLPPFSPRWPQHLNFSQPSSQLEMWIKTHSGF